MFKILLINGLIIGGIYALIALGYSLIYRASGLMTFAQGDMITFGAYIGLTFYKILGLSFSISFFLTFISAFIFELYGRCYPCIIKQNVIPNIYSSCQIAVSYIIRIHAGTIWDHNHTIPASIQGRYFDNIWHYGPDRGLCLFGDFINSHVFVAYIYEKYQIRRCYERCRHGSSGS